TLGGALAESTSSATHKTAATASVGPSVRLMPMNLMSMSWLCLILVAPCVVACGGGGDSSPPKSNEWDGHTYSLSIGDRSWTEPRGVINDIKDYVPEFLFEVHG